MAEGVALVGGGAVNKINRDVMTLQYYRYEHVYKHLCTYVISYHINNFKGSTPIGTR